MKQDVCITVCDNGNGMAPDKLEKLRAKLENASEEPIWAQGSHIGLSNVSSRIRMNFGVHYGVTTDSEQESVHVSPSAFHSPQQRREKYDQSINCGR